MTERSAAEADHPEYPSASDPDRALLPDDVDAAATDDTTRPKPAKPTEDAAGS